MIHSVNIYWAFAVRQALVSARDIVVNKLDKIPALEELAF